jgi:hypothetical protein
MTTITMKEVAAFLLGEDSLDGYWFGERHPISPFWWREHLRAAQPATAPEPVAWLAHYVGRSGMEQEYVSTDKNLADENDASGKALPLYLHPPATAPAQPEIVDLLAEMYDLILANKVVLAEKSGGVWTWPDRAIEAVRKHRSGPAQPERKPTTDAQCIELFHKVQRGMGFKDHDVIPFISGVAAGEHFHGIKETP